MRIDVIRCDVVWCCVIGVVWCDVMCSHVVWWFMVWWNVMWCQLTIDAMWCHVMLWYDRHFMWCHGMWWELMWCNGMMRCHKMMMSCVVMSCDHVISGDFMWYQLMSCAVMCYAEKECNLSITKVFLNVVKIGHRL